MTAAAPALSQESRAEILGRRRAEKAARVQPYMPGRIERALLYLEAEDPLRKVAPFDGFFVRYGYAGKPLGSGMGLGAGFRHDLFNRRARLVLEGGATLRNYRMVRGDFSLPHLAGGRLELGVEASDRHDPQEDFYGLGAESLETGRVNFLFDRRDIQGRVVAKPAPGVRLGGRLGRVTASIGRGTDTRFPSIDERFGESSAPGLAAQPAFSYRDLFAEVDRRDQPGNARSGGFYSLAWRDYSDRDLDAFSFRRVDAELMHFFPIFDKKRVIAVRGRWSSTWPGDGDAVPFYFQPTLGGADSLRSVRDFRFRDRHAVSLNAEYRWEAFSGLDMALFSDWGQVAPRAADLDLDRMKHAYGLGFRFNTYKAVFLRLDIATGAGEGLVYFVKFSRAF